MKKILLTDCCELVMGQSPVSSSYNTEKRGLPFYQGNADFGKINPITRCWCDKPIKIAYKDDILISVRAPIGAINIASEECCIGRGLAAVRALKGKCLYEFLYYALQSNTEELKSQGTGSTFKAISKQILANSELPDITLEEQHRIVNRLLKVDTLIENANEQLRLFDQLVKSRFIEMFGDFKRNVHGYPTCNIGVVAKLQGGYAFKSNDFIDYGVRLVQIGNVNKDNLDWNTNICLPENFLIKYKAFSLREDDIVMALTRPIIKSLSAVKIAVVGKNDLPSLLNQRVGRFVVNEKLINRTYLMYLCRMEDFKNYVESMSGNSLQPNISSNQVENYNILLPPLELQNQFADFVEQVNKSKFTHCYELLLLIIKKIWYNNYV